MHALVTVSLLAAVWACARLAGRCGADRGLAMALGVVLAFSAVAVFGAGLGHLGWFTPGTISALLAGLAAVVHVITRLFAPTPATPTRAPYPILLALIVGGAALLRVPAMPQSLAGRDPGSYSLIADHLERTGGFILRDTLLANASREEADAAPGVDHLRALYRVDRPAPLAGYYDAPYRPGLYVADARTGSITPQFLRGYPAVLVAARWGLGLDAGSSVLFSLCTLLAVAAVAAAWLPHSRLALLPPLFVAVSPMAIWSARVPLSEAFLGALLACAAAMLLGAARRHLFAAVLLGTATWCHGSTWLAAPAVALCLLWGLGSSGVERQALRLLAVLATSSAIFHGFASYPYIHDELLKQLPGETTATPTQLAGLVVAAAVVGWVARRNLAARSSRRLPLRWLLWTATALVAWTVVRSGEGHARLDALLPALGPAVLWVGLLGVTAHRWAPAHADPWWVALAAGFTLLSAAYARTNLPSADLYYYGRYLVPLWLPVVALGSTRVIAQLAALPRLRNAALVVGLLSTLWPAHRLATAPITRLQEFSTGAEFVDAIAARLPEHAVVIAGGEGWHRGHTYNQIGGALTLRHGITTLPYRDAHTAWATAQAVRAAAPKRPVFLLLNESAHPLTDGSAPPRVGLDLALVPPLHAKSVQPFELYVHRLTPSPSLPTRVTRDALRLALVELDTDPEPETRVERWDTEALRDLREGSRARCPGHSGASYRIDRPEPGWLWLRASPKTSPHLGQWRVAIDEQALPRQSQRLSLYAPRDTLGPYWLPAGANTVTVRGTREPLVAGVQCHRGVLAELVYAPARTPPRFADPIRVTPAQDLGHPEPTYAWGPSTSYTVFRPGVRPKPTRHRLSLRLEAGTGHEFESRPWPPAPRTWVLALTESHASPTARVEIRIGAQLVATLSPPAERSGLWRSEPFAIPGQGDARLRIEFVGKAGDWIALRDLTAFGPAALAGADAE